MKKGIAILVAALTAAWAAATEPRTWRFAAPERPAIQTQDSVEWVQGESVDLEYALPAPLADGQTALWEITQGSNLYSYAAAEAGETALRWRLAPDETTLPPGRYAGRVAVYSTAGGKTTFHRVLAQQGIRVYKGIADFEELQPVPWYDGTELEKLEEAVETNAADLASLRADYDTDIGSLFDSVDYLERATNALDTATAVLQGNDQAQFDTLAALQMDISRLKSATNSLEAALGQRLPAYRDGLGNWHVNDSHEGTTFPHGAYGPYGEWLNAVANTQLVRKALSIDGKLSLDSVAITRWGDLTNELHATLSAHTSATNPHGVTAEQLGAPTVADLNAVSNALNTKFSSYLPLTGGIISGGGSLGITSHNGGARFFQGNNVDASGVYASAMGEYAQATAQDASAIGYHVIASAFAAMARGGWTEATKSYATAMGRTATASNEFAYTWSGVNLYPGRYGSHGDGTWNINPQGGLSGAYVGETNLADHIAAAVAPVEQRVGELEESAEEYWCKWTSSSLSIIATNWIPVDWPARTVYCYAYCASGTNTIAVPADEDFAPAAAHTLHLRIFKAADAAVYVRAAGGGSAIASLTGGSIIHRDVVLAWRPGIGWICTQITISAAPMAVGSDDWTRHVYASDLPEDETFAPVILDSSPQLTLSPSLSPSAGHLEAPGGLDDLDVQGKLDSLDELDEADEAEEKIEEEMR